MLKKDVYTAKIKNIEDKISSITNLATKTILNSKINEVKCEILLTMWSIKCEVLLTKLVLLLLLLLKIKYLMFVISSNKTDYNTKIKKIEKTITDHDHI